MKYADVKNVPSEITKNDPGVCTGFTCVKNERRIAAQFCLLSAAAASVCIAGLQVTVHKYLYRYSAVRSSFSQVKCKICQDTEMRKIKMTSRSFNKMLIIYFA